MENFIALRQSKTKEFANSTKGIQGKRQRAARRRRTGGHYISKVFTFGSPGICMDWRKYQLRNQTDLHHEAGSGRGIFYGMRVVAYDARGKHDVVSTTLRICSRVLGRKRCFNNMHVRTPILKIHIPNDDDIGVFQGPSEYFWPMQGDSMFGEKLPGGLANAAGVSNLDKAAASRCHTKYYNFDYTRSELDTSASSETPADLTGDLQHLNDYFKMSSSFDKPANLMSFKLVASSTYATQCSSIFRLKKKPKICKDMVQLYQHKKDLSCHLVFEGSDGLEDPNDWISNANGQRQFWCGLRDLHKGLVSELRANLRSKAYQERVKVKLSKCAGVIAVGHSKGGAQAHLFTACANRYGSISGRNGHTDHALVTWDPATPEAMDEIA